MRLMSDVKAKSSLRLLQIYHRLDPGNLLGHSRGPRLEVIHDRGHQMKGKPIQRTGQPPSLPQSNYPATADKGRKMRR